MPMTGFGEARDPSSRFSRGGAKRRIMQECRIATWNIRGRMDGKMNELCDMMKEKCLDLLCVTESWKKGSGSMENGDTLVLWSGLPETDRACGGLPRAYHPE
jgi:hypothetical protein